MTASWTETQSDDPVRHFTNALTPAARHHLHLNYEAIRYVNTACQHRTPIELARICSAGIGWHHPSNAAALLLYRLRREARIDNDDDQEADSR